VEEGIRGLGGGLEYAIAPDFFERILPVFVDQVRPTKAQLLEAIRRAFDRWAAGSPLRFVDVSDRVFALRDLGGSGSGAEIDLLAVPKGDLAFRNTTLAANTSLTLKKEKPIGTNGRELPGRTITSADILFNTDALYYFDPNDPEVRRLQSTGWTLMHFESLLLHEIGHALGLDHPDEYPERNFDTDTNPSTPMIIDCQYPLQGVKPSSSIDWNAVMISQDSGTLRLDLTYDDLGGRDFLYPPCGMSSPSPGPSPRAGSPSLQRFDQNGNNLLDDPEFFAVIDAWIAGEIDDPTFFQAIDLWVAQLPIASAGWGSSRDRETVQTRSGPSGVLFVANSSRTTRMAVHVYDANGRLVYAQTTTGAALRWNLARADGRRLANGVYLYAVTVRGANGEILRREVRKLVVLR